MSFLFNVQINIVLSILLTILLVHAYFNMNKTKITNKLFLWVMGLTFLILILEIVSVILNNPNLKQLMVVHKLVNLFGFIIAPIIPFLGYIFIKEWVARYQNYKIKLKRILLLPLLINMIGALISYNGGQLFYISSENTYVRGPLFFILPITSYIYFVYSLYFIYKHRSKMTYTEFIIFNIFYIIPVIVTAIQLKYCTYFTIWNSSAIIIVVVYVFILDDQAYRDNLTGFENRLSFEHYAQNISNKRLNNLIIVYIDLDDLKLINDQYGHCEGDKAIKVFTELLFESFKLTHAKLIRLGGDEFLILIEASTQEKVTTYIDNLTKSIKQYNNTRENPYSLKFSYGMVGYTNQHENIYQLLKYADQLMYEQKKARKSKALELHL